MILKKSLADEVAHNIQEKIVTGIYVADSKLPIEPTLMQVYGVGRSTIREAMKLLSNSGFIRVQQGIGTFVEAVTKRKKTSTNNLSRPTCRMWKKCGTCLN